MGPLKGLKIIEMAGIGPGPFCGMVLADLGAKIIRVDRASAIGTGSKQDAANRGKKSIAVDLKSEEGVEVVLKLVETADAIFEGFRPGVMERLGLGPDVCSKRNERIVFGRMTGWGQEGPLANAAGHDINYISLTGALAAIGRPGSPPVPPLNLIGDFGGGGMLLALGLVAALLEAKESKKGQVVDAAMTDGSALLMTMIYTMQSSGVWKTSMGSNLLDGGSHFYDTYECKDGKFISLGSIEPQFYALLCQIAELDESIFGNQMSRDSWPEKKEAIKKIILDKTRDEWCELMEGTDVCFAPVLDMSEAPKHPHNVERKTFIDLEGVTQPAPAPRFSRTEPEVVSSPSVVGEHTDEVLTSIGLSDEDINTLKTSGAVA
ncbi:MAG: CaiB/BaiF CoA transferase family protein [SAR86 cluster bacterium]